MPLGALLQCMAGAPSLSSSLLAFLSFVVFFIVKIDEVNPFQSSSIVEFWLLVFPLLFFSILSGITYFSPHFWPHVIWSGSLLIFCQYLPGPQ